MKKVILAIIIFFQFFIFNSSVFAQDDNAIIFLNQVRGNECCQPGNINYLGNQIQEYKNNNFSATFSVRYDVLDNSDYVKLLKNLDTSQFEVGAFLEITPALAKDSGVEYLANDENWSRANHAYTVGYDFNDRRKIINTYMNKFYSVFGYYPKTTTAWIMDTSTLNYLHDTFGVTSHQITREQWGTDSYTLYGGPVHYPYFASKNWAFMPGGKNSNNDGLLILRQTGSDPLYNYGDKSNAFTTQPNDYTLDGKDISYFDSLSSELLLKQNNKYGFLLLGIENSMVEKYQNEYLDQIKLLAQKGGFKTYTAKDFNQKYTNIINDSKIISLNGSDIVSGTKNKVLWINTRKYRIRVLLSENEIKITDIRIYDENIEDPYNNKVASRDSFWIAPFAIDGSRFYQHNDKFVVKDLKSLLQNRYLPELDRDNFEIKSVLYDFISDSDGIVIKTSGKNSDYKIIQDDDSITIEYLDNKRTQSQIKFNLDSFSIPNNDVSISLENSDFLHSNAKGIALVSNGKTYFNLNKECNEYCIFSFPLIDNATYLNLLNDFYYLYFPEINIREINQDNSIFYAHNKYSVLNKNPVRFVFMPRDNYDLPAFPDQEFTTEFEPEVTKTELHDTLGNGLTFFDVYSDKIGKYTLKLNVNGINKLETFYIAPNCKEEISYCMLHPRRAYWYLKSMFITKLRDF